MAAVAFDTLKFARRLMEAGVPEAQAEVQAELMSEAFVFNLDALVTRDYLDERLDRAIEGVNHRIDAVEARLGARLSDHADRFDRLEARMEAGFARHERRFERLESSLNDLKADMRLVKWVMAAIAASTLYPLLERLVA